MTAAGFAVLGVSALAWSYLALFHWRFWRSDQTLPQTSGTVGAWPFVVAIVPARNEEAVIAKALTALAAQDYPGRLEIIVVNDDSADNTAAIAKQVTGRHPVTVLDAKPLIAGWAGKLWALHQGTEVAAHKFPKARYLWFSDADIVHGPGVLEDLVEAAILDNRNMVSQMVCLHCRSFWERAFVPAFIYFFEMLYPFPAANSDKTKMAGAAGGCILLERRWLENIGGIARIRTALIDDCALAAAIKGAGGRIWLGFGLDSRSIRPYSFRDFWTTVARTAFTQLRNSALLLLGTLAALTLVFVAPPAFFLAGLVYGKAAFALGGGVLWLLMAGLYAPTLRLYALGPVRGLALPAVAILYMAMTVHSAFRHWLGRGGRWKERTYDFGKKENGP